MPAARPIDFLPLVERLADASGDVIRRYFRRRIAIDTKDDDSPVTAADREAEAAIRKIIEAEHPDHGILGEEHGTTRLGADFVWVIDPIDGTKSFISGVPVFGTLIALLHEGKPVVGAIDQPITRERWMAAAGGPATLNGRPVTTRACAGLDAATLTSTSPDMFTGADADVFGRLRAAVGLVRYGYDCYGYAMLASGHIDLVLESQLAPYDYCALVPVVEAAGGVLSDWSGRALDLGSDGRMLGAGDPALHEAALEIISS